jgi:hypothetical protein
MNPYIAPGTRATNAEDDIAEAAPPALARVAGGSVGLSGLVVGLTGVQTMAMVTIRGGLAVAPYVLFALGATHLVLATFVFRARLWAALGAVAGCFVQSVASGAWLYVSVTHQLFSLYALAGPFVSLGAAGVALLAVGPCQRASAARERLKAAGMDLGI